MGSLYNEMVTTVTFPIIVITMDIYILLSYVFMDPLGKDAKKLSTLGHPTY